MAKQRSFLPEDYLERRIARRTNFICISLFIVVMSAIVGAYFVKLHESHAVLAIRHRVDRRFADAAKRIEQMQNLQEKKQQMIQKAKITSALVEKIPRSTLLAELTNNMPVNLSLLSLDLETKTVRQSRSRTALQRAKRKSAKKAGSFKVDIPKTVMTITLVGVAPSDVDVSKYMSNLGKRPLFENVSLSYSEQTKVNDMKMRKFGIQMQVDQTLNLHQVKPMKVERKLLQNPMSQNVQLHSASPQSSGAGDTNP